MRRSARVKKKARLKRALELTAGRLIEKRSGGLVVDLGEVVLGGLRTVGDELAEIFGGGLRPRDEHFAARADHIGLDLNRLVERLGGRKLVDAREEGLGVLIKRLLDIAADLGGLADRIRNGGLDRGGQPLRTRLQGGSTVLGGCGRLLCGLTSN